MNETDLPTTIEDDDSSENFYEKQVLKLTTVASFSSILANILISITIIKFKNLRRDVTYSIILHLVLVQIVSLVLDEVLLWFFTYFGTPLPQFHTEFCIIFVGVRMLNAISFLILILLVCNWYFKLFCNQSKYSRFAKYHGLLLAFIYLVAIVLLPFLAKLCLKKDVFATFYVVLSFQVLMIVASVAMNVVNKWKNRQSFDNDSGLGVANVTMIFCTPAYLFLILAYFNVIPVYIVLFADVLATGVFPFVLFYLYRYDRNFQMYFKKLFVCRRAYSESESVSYNLINNVDP
ncbi:hypothetical protein TcasGA2_TC034474 [Tribolium castaneum]|uniref:G-protein coupled receptors family 1 profile domain-containing protein n=1 Tax=Tribolium castaneum TaxID=7070 RepID=A0A139WBV0_TRICA|nr:PREDICTED: uncharacterized protein LOC100142624 [Tribolium castaneum]KYB25438.1 hypothetical protein TcasGA2_TC034474 [Tribolium castaneum]|eukprot:XP_001810765.1 PREDICTED: uncharacterized protein LOC100142624 [Tribolium castaneum]